MDSAGSAIASLKLTTSAMMPTSNRKRSQFIQMSKSTPRTCLRRLQESANEGPIDTKALVRDPSSYRTSSDTVLYLGYGSNLCAETFLGKRKIRPLSQINVVVPSIALTFDLPGLPYAEPCFANTRYVQVPGDKQESAADYHKDYWHKGLVGVVYEVTKSDYAHIIATEGGGSGYQDVVVGCFPLSRNPRDKVPTTLEGVSFKAHTLLAPAEGKRSDPSYAQPSARYLKLITDGAAEHSLPYEYQDFLHQIRPYQRTTFKQRLAMPLFMMVWAPIMMLLLRGLGVIFVRPDGTYPPWLAKLMRVFFAACWGSYDDVFRPLFGDGERTTGELDENHTSDVSEKAPLIQEAIQRYGVGGSLETMV